MTETPAPPLLLCEQVLLSSELVVLAHGDWLPGWLGQPFNRSQRGCLERPIVEVLAQLSAAAHALDLSKLFLSLLHSVQQTRRSQSTSIFTLRRGRGEPTLQAAAQVYSLRLTLTPLVTSARELPSFVLAFEDMSAYLSAEHRHNEQRQQHEQALLALRAELEGIEAVRTADLEHTNAELLREIAEHMKTETTLRNTQEQLHHAQRLEAVGRLAGGIAHDFNNLLSIVLGYSTTMLEELPKETNLYIDVQEIQRAGQRASELTRQLLAFGRQQVLAPRVIDLNDVVLRMDRMMQRILGEDILIVTLPAAQLWAAKLDPGQLEQVLVNLLINARDAMPTGGTLTIETANQHYDDDYAHAHLGAIAGPYVVLAVSDTGVGMTKDVQSRVFEPFFTTKKKGKGTGLGLATVFGIVKQSGGHIWLYSEPDKGTTFKLCFPRCTDPIDEQPQPVTAPTASVPGGHETILLVEDDAQLLVMARGALTRQGYRILDAANPIEALKLSADFAEPIALLLTDVVMPHMSGRELAHRLLELRPATKVLYMSGYTDNAIVHGGILDAGVAFLQKPVTPETLARRVREVLDGPADGGASGR